MTPDTLIKWITAGNFLLQVGATSIAGLISLIHGAHPALPDTQLNEILLGVISDATTRKAIADRDAGIITSVITTVVPG